MDMIQKMLRTNHPTMLSLLSDPVSYFMRRFSIFYKRNKDKVVLNSHGGFLMQTKVSSSDEGGVAAGLAVLENVSEKLPLLGVSIEQYFGGFKLLLLGSTSTSSEFNQ